MIMKGKKILASVLIFAGITMMAVPFFWRLQGEKETDKNIRIFEQTLEVERSEEQEKGKKKQTSLSEEEKTLFKEGDVIGIIEIKSLGIRYPVMEGTEKTQLNAGIGHIPGTAGIGGKGNCVLCGHNGSRYGTFFTTLNRVKKGDNVIVLDRQGKKHSYEVEKTWVVDPYDNSIKEQGNEETLTLFTCAQRGTMRFVVRCSPVVSGKETQKSSGSCK